MDSVQDQLFRTNGGFGGKYVNSTGLISGGPFYCIHALTDMTILGQTACNIESISGASVPAGHDIYGQFTVIHVDGTGIIYK